MSELYAVLKTLKDNKAPGDDRIPYEFFKNAPDSFLEKLLHCYNYIYNSRDVPSSFKTSIILPLFKKGDINEVSNFRGISFKNSAAKILMLLLIKRFEDYLDEHEIMKESQAGFRTGYSTVDCIFSLINIIEIKCNKKNGRLYAFFIDFKSAFDYINHEDLYFKFSCQGISTKFINIIRALNSNATAAVWNGEELSEWFMSSLGLKQGCPSSPKFFTFFINDLEDNIDGGISIDGKRIKSLLYADDSVLLADNPATLQRMIRDLEVYCARWNLNINIAKSKVMIFGKSGRAAKKEKWFLGKEEIEVVKNFKYLGISLTPKISLHSHFQEKLNSIKLSINYMWSQFPELNKVSTEGKFKIFDSLFKTAMCYGAQIWGFEEYEEVEKLQRYFIKKLFFLPQFTPTYMLHIETERQKLFIYTFELHIKYIMKVLKLKETRLPNFLAKKCIEKNLYWVKTWRSLGDKYNFEISFNNLTLLEENMIKIYTRIREELQLEFESKARNSVKYVEYAVLNYNVGPLYIFKNYSVYKIMLLFKARSGLLGLNGYKWESSESKLCSTCNMGEIEDTYHFVAVCPTYKQYRLSAFKTPTVADDIFYNIINGSDFEALYKYLSSTLKYRTFLIKEFNY